MQVADARDRLVARLRAGEAGAELLDHLQHLQDFDEIVLGEAPHDGALGRRDLDQAFADQALDRLPQRRARDAEDGADLAFIDPRAGREPAFDDHVAQLIEHFAVERAAHDARHVLKAVARQGGVVLGHKSDPRCSAGGEIHYRILHAAYSYATLEATEMRRGASVMTVCQ